MAALFCSQNLTTWGSLHMGVWKERGLEVGRSSRMDAKPCGHLNVYVSGRLDVHHPCDPPCRWGLAVVRAAFLFAQNPTKRWYNCFAFGFARHNLSRSALQNLLFASPASPSASQTCLYKFSLFVSPCLRRLVCVALRLAKFNLRFFSNQLSLNIH